MAIFMNKNSKPQGSHQGEPAFLSSTSGLDKMNELSLSDCGVLRITVFEYVAKKTVETKSIKIIKLLTHGFTHLNQTFCVHDECTVYIQFLHFLCCMLMLRSWIKATFSNASFLLPAATTAPQAAAWSLEKFEARLKLVT